MMRKDNSRRDRNSSFGGKKRGDSERKNFRKREDDKGSGRSFSDKPKRTYRDDKPRDDSSPEERSSYAEKPNENSPGDKRKFFRDVKPKSDSPGGQKRSYYGKSNEGSFGDRRKNFRDDRKQSEPPSFMHKKKYADRVAKVEKNKRKFDFGQEFTNKKENINKEGFERREKRNSFGDKRKTFTPRESFGDRRREESPERRERKPFGDERKNKFRSDKKPFRSKQSSETANAQTGTDLIRLNKYISNSGVCSRREADDMITAGIISVNGEIVTRLGTKISPTDVVKYNNETLKRERNVYVLLNKPKDYITTADDPEKRNTVMELVADACKERIYPVGRLDRNTTGVLLFTNDGELTKKLTHPGSNIKKVYHVELDRNVKAADLDKIAGGIELEDGMAHVDAISYDDPVDKSHIGIELHSGKNRIVRRIFEALEYEVRKLDRVYFAGLTKKDLPRGRWRFLTELEISSLKMKSGKKSRVKTE